ncbi:MAG: restriction endonuclease subunit S [Polyangiaceae bacterium]|nr:restriction endonuclease subunit S [Polyangiaceae bacterium]
MNERLPRGWSKVSVGRSCRLVNGRAFKPTDWTDEGLPIIRIQNLNNHKAAFNRYAGVVERKFLVEDGELLFAWSGTPGTSFGAHIWQRGQAILNQHIFRVLDYEELFDKSFLRYAINDRLSELIDLAHGGAGLAHVTKPKFEATELALPPLNEQRRIVAKLEALQARSRRARGALDAVPPLLEKLRQSILAAAFRGDLTKDWRAKHKNVEPASELLKRIRTERRRKWEESELAKMKAKGKAPTDDKWKAKYKEPEPVDATGLPELPEGWCWAPLPTLGELARGKSKHRPRNDPALFGNAIPFIQTGEVARAEGRITSHSTMYSPFGVAQSRIFPRGTVCITIAANIADTGILDFDACFPDSVVGFVADGGPIVASYVELFIRTARVDLKRFAPATAQANINLEVLGEVAVPVPTHEEMVLLVERVERAMARVTSAAASHASVDEQLLTLERAQLAKAFRGELVPQDPNDEPAKEILAQLQAPSGGSTSSLKSRREASRKRPSA